MRAFAFILLPVFLLLGCKQEGRVREPYTEIRTRAEVKPARDGGSEGFEWTTPEGWAETPGDSSARGGISIDRIANFTVRGDGEEATVTLTAFPTSGGVAANLDRWLRQLLASPEEAEKEAFLAEGLEAFETKSGQDGRFADLSRFVPDDPAARSMLTGTVPLTDGRVLYIKMSGPRGLLAAQADAFRSLCQSIVAP